MIQIKPESAWRGTSDCRNCPIRNSVLFADLTEADFEQIHAPIDDIFYAKGSTLVEEGGASSGVFTIRAGMVKIIRNTNLGIPRVVRVMRPGDVIGLEALVLGRYETEAIALTDVSACRIPISVIQSLAINSPRLHVNLMRKWSHNQKESEDWLAELNFGTARDRVTSFILKMRDSVSQELVTLFSREDMGSMLDLKLETVSREINKLVREGIIKPLDSRGRLYKILKQSSLQLRK